MLQRLDGKTGEITERLRAFVTHTLGNPEVSQSELQRTWSDLIQELSRIHGLRSYIEIVADVATRITLSGAPLWAEALKLPIDGATDSHLPDNWKLAWRYRRVATHLAKIDQQERLHQLSAQRKTFGNATCQGI